MKEEKLNNLINVLDILPMLFEDEISFIVGDREKIIGTTSTEHMPAVFKVGDLIPKNDILYKCMQDGHNHEIITDKCEFNFCIKVVGIPIKENGKIIGAISYGRSLKNSDDIMELSKSVYSNVSSISDFSSSLKSKTQEITELNESISKSMSEVNNSVSSSNEIVSIIKAIANKSNILGINAAIEASRAGDLGRGFGVVATEIRKLSTLSKESIEDINNMLKALSETSCEMDKRVNTINEASKFQSEAIEKIVIALEGLKLDAEKLEKMSQKL